jgi:hypothetical protein
MFKPEEIQEILAEFENRISFLENCLSGSAMAPIEKEEVKELPEKPWNKKQWDVIVQVRGEMLNLKRKFLDLEKLVTSKGSKYVYK